MTTIAYRDGIMASDSLLYDYGGVGRKCQKIYFLDDAIIGTAGEGGELARFLTWWKNGHNPKRAPRRENAGPIHVIVVHKSGAVELWDENYYPEPVEEAFCAVGCGSMVALGAMEVGASAKEAVEAACKWSVETKGPVKTVDIYKLFGIKKNVRPRKRRRVSRR